MVNLARYGVLLFAALFMTAPVFCQNDTVKPIGERLDEVRALVDAEYENIAALQQHLNNATDAKDASRIEKIREEMDYAWTEIDRLKSLEEMLLDLKAKALGSSNPRPRRATGGGRSGFNSDSSSGGQGERGNSAMMEDGSTPNGFRGDTSTGERPKRAMPGAENDRELDSSAPRPDKTKQRPQRATGAGQPAQPGQPGPAPPLTSKKLRQLESSLESLIAAGEMDLADRVRKSIEVEKKKLEREAKELEDKERRDQQTQGGDRPVRAGGGGLAGTEPDSSRPSSGAKGKSKEDLIKELEDLIKQLQDENKELRDKKDGDR